MQSLPRIALSGNPEIDLLPRAGFVRENLGAAPHSRVWRWYAGTTDLNITEFASQASGDSEAIFRSEADQVRSLFKGGNVPWYIANGVALDAPDAPWEGIGTGWFFSPQGGGQPSSIITGTPVSFNNTEVPHGSDPAVPTIFNGNFEYGNLHPLARYPGLVTRDSLATPGWAFHGGSFVSASRLDVIKTDETGNYVAELNSEPTGNAKITHNRFYISENAQTLEFFGRVISKEFFRTGTITAYLKLGDRREALGSFQVTETSGQYTKYSFSLDNTAFGNVAGKIMQIEFELVYSGQAGPQSGVDKVWLDDIRLVGAGQPLRAESPAPQTHSAQEVTSTGLTSLIDAARSGWESLIETPDRVGGTTLRSLLVPADHFSSPGKDLPDKHLHSSGNAGLGKGCFDEQLFLANRGALALVPGTDEVATVSIGLPADEFSLDRHAPFAADGHAVQAQSDPSLRNNQVPFIIDAGVRHGGEALIVKDGATEDQGAIGVSNFQVSLDAAVPSSQRTIPDLQIFNLEEFPFLGFEPFSRVLVQFTGGGYRT